MSPGVRPKASAIARMFSPTGAEQVDLPARPRPDGHLAHVHVGHGQQRPVLAGDHHRHRAVAAARDERAAALERDEREVGRPAAAAEPLRGVDELLRPDHDVAVDGQPGERLRHPVERGLVRARRVAAAEPAGPGERRRARSPARSSRRGSAPPPRATASPARAPPTASRLRLRRLGALEHELHHAADRLLDVAVLDHRDVRALGPRDDRVLDPPDLGEAADVLVGRAGAVGRRRRGRRSASGARPRPRSRARTGRPSRPSIGGGIRPGTRCTPSSTIDQPSCSARSSAARTPTRTLRVCSRKPATAASTASSGARSAAPASKLE